MERHKCKLCSRSFANGRALGGHMKAHLATLPLPPKPAQKQAFTTSLTFSSPESESEQEVHVEEEDEVLALREAEEKALIYGLRENPKKSFRVADPTSFVVVQDRESETESKNPTRQRSKRNRQNQNSEPRKVKMSFMVSTSSPEPEQPLSSVSDTSPEEDVAMCLMMMSRDKWTRNINHNGGCSSSKEIKFKRVRGKHACENCGKAFRSSRALGSHRSVCCVDKGNGGGGGGGGGDEKIFECPFCYKVFGSGQALGGHKRSHLIASSSSNANNNVGSGRLKQSLIDLNLPAPPEEDDLSVVSDA